MFYCGITQPVSKSSRCRLIFLMVHLRTKTHKHTRLRIRTHGCARHPSPIYGLPRKHEMREDRVIFRNLLYICDGAFYENTAKDYKLFSRESNFLDVLQSNNASLQSVPTERINWTLILWKFSCGIERVAHYMPWIIKSFKTKWWKINKSMWKTGFYLDRLALQVERHSKLCKEAWELYHLLRVRMKYRCQWNVFYFCDF